MNIRSTFDAEGTGSSDGLGKLVEARVSSGPEGPVMLGLTASQIWLEVVLLICFH